jgi:galactokinase
MILETVKTKFKEIFHNEPEIIVRSPGRINVIGEHTDYNGGYVLPAAIDKAVYFAVSPRDDNECRFVANDINQSFNTSLDNLVKTDTHAWANYLMGVLKTILDLNNENNTLEIDNLKLTIRSQLRGVNVVFGADLPSGGGMSSSAAIENGIGFAVNTLFDLGLSRMDLVKISQHAENHFVGMNCGIMDMFASMMGIENKVMRIDCRSLQHEYFSLNAPDLCFILCDTGVKHALVDSEYNTRRAECEECIKYLQQYNPSIKTLRDVPLDFLRKYKDNMRKIVFMRCEYVLEEIKRVEKACTALRKSDFEALGQLMYQSHEGLNKKYEVSCPELNFLVEKAHKTEGVLGARMMGGGFGGCTINLVKANRVEAFVKKLQDGYLRIFNKEMPYYVVTLQNGTDIVEKI